MGVKENLQAAYATLQAAVARIGPMPVPQLGAELMPLFQPSSPEVLPPTLAISELAGQLAPGFIYIPTHPAHRQLQAYLQQLIREGVQALEHASLVCIQFEHRGGGSSYLNYQATRRGLVALAQQGAVERILWANQPEV
jgi:hypothetical protein